MYSLTATRYNLLKHLRILFKVLNCLGLTGLSFNQSKQKFEQTRCRQKVTSCVYKFIKYFSGLLILNFLCSSLWRYLTTSTYQSPKSVEAQEETISAISGYIHTTSVFIYSLNYFRNRDSLVNLFNEGLRIFKKLKSRTGPELFLSQQINSFLVAKGVILAFIMKFVISLTLMMMYVLCFINIDFTLFPIVCALMSFSYIYIQLILLCFYVKMNEYLVTCGLVMGERELMSCVREFMYISRRIHNFKQRLHPFASSVFICTYLGLFHDIQFTYLTLKTVFYSKYFLNYSNDWDHLNIYFPACLSYIVDMFIIGLLSDMLEDANDKFQGSIMMLSNGMQGLQRDVEVMLMRDNICGLGFCTFGQIKINQKFSFDFTMNIILVFVIVFLQFFAAEQIYIDHFEKVNITKSYANNL